MNDLRKVKYKDGRPYTEYIHKSGKKKGCILRNYGQIIICRICGEKCFATNSNIKKGYGKFCCHGCHTQGENNSRWKGGKRKSRDGYVLIYNPEHPFCDKNGYVLEHRLIVEKKIGRFLKAEEVVHHINKIKTDNRLENLMVFKNNGSHRNFEQGNKINLADIIWGG